MIEIIKIASKIVVGWVCVWTKDDERLYRLES